jgi:hypothetical protein
MKLGIYIMAPEPISAAYFINPSLQSVSVCVSLLSLQDNDWVIRRFGARQRIGKHVAAATNTGNNRIIFGRVCLWVCLRIPLSPLGNNPVKTFPRQGRIVGGVVFYAVVSYQRKVGD